MSVCSKNCENRVFSITKPRQPYGLPCYDDDGETLLREGEERSCIGYGSCRGSINEYLCGETSLFKIGKIRQK